MFQGCGASGQRVILFAELKKSAGRVKIYRDSEEIKMKDELTQKDIDRMKEEIEYRILEVRKKAL